MARIGSPKLFLSDNAAHFVAARKQIMKQPLNINEDEIADKLQLKSVDWRLNPQSAPHFGGVWERLVLIIKRVFLLNLGSDRLSRDLFSTIVVECQGLIKSRPLIHVSCDINDILPITHFLLGSPFIYAPAASFCDQSNSNKLSSKSWKLTKDRLDSFWKRLKKEYAPTLIKRTKWNQKEENIEKQDLVWILEVFTPRGIWPLGKVVETFTGPVGIARSCVTKNALGTLMGTAVKLL